jgi:hypothetical protein
MSKISFDIKEEIIINELKMSPNPYKIKDLSNKEESLSDEKDDSELTYKFSTKSPNTSNSEKYKSFCQSLSSEQSNISDNKININNVNKTKPLEFYYFLCNENYYKEKNPEGSKYKKKSKNYISKNELNCIDTIKIEDLNLDKINDILEDFKSIENFQDDTKIKLMNNDNKEAEYSNFSNILSMQNDPICVNIFSFFPYVNNYNFDCKSFIILLLFYYYL